jgi:hypothetical protein
MMDPWPVPVYQLGYAGDDADKVSRMTFLCICQSGCGQSHVFVGRPKQQGNRRHGFRARLPVYEVEGRLWQTCAIW